MRSASAKAIDICRYGSDVSSHVDATAEGVLCAIVCRTEVHEVYTAAFSQRAQPCSDAKRPNLYVHYEMGQET